MPQKLTRTESEIMRDLVDTSLAVKEIANKRGSSPNTIAVHVTNIYSKLGVHSRIELIQNATKIPSQGLP